MPEALFDKRRLDRMLKYVDASGATYYKAILQNLFFATLNTEMGEARRFRGKNPKGRDAHFGVASVYRYARCFADPDAALKLFADIPFLNGGLFECLDDPQRDVRIDGFSDRDDNELRVPDELFFANEHKADLSEAYGDDRRKRENVRGLIRILDRYKFTVNENTPIEEEVALDPELLGKVFENLLAEYNPETGTTARKQTGSFYTPREIVNYMVDEALIAQLTGKLVEAPDAEARLRRLFAYTDEPNPFAEAETEALIAAIDSLKMLDPACGSGAFPMGVLHKLVFILGKLDPGNEQWKEKQLAKAAAIDDSTARTAAVEAIEQAFDRHELDYGRKLYLIENCIYGVDIQPIAAQIAKLRCFISLVVDQRVDAARPNRGVIPLPNLETKFVAANTLISLQTPQHTLRSPEVAMLETRLADARRKHFHARTPKTKDKYRALDQELRRELATLLKREGWPPATADLLAAWNPYDQNASAEFFDQGWMFGLKTGFEVVIGNPPYVRPHKIDPLLKQYLWKHLKTFVAKSDLYSCFMERGLEYLTGDGLATFIVPRTWTSLESFSGIRELYATTTQVIRLVQLPKKVFDDSAVETCIFLVQKNDSPSVDHEIQVESLAENGDRTFVRRFLQSEIPHQHLHNFQLYVREATSSLTEKLKAKATGLAALVDFAYGFKTGDDARFIHSEPTTKDCKAFIRSAAIHRYYYDPPAEFVRYVPEKMLANRKTARPGDKRRFESEKIVVSRMGMHLNAAYDNGGLYCLASVGNGQNASVGKL